MSRDELDSGVLIKTTAPINGLCVSLSRSETHSRERTPVALEDLDSILTKSRMGIAAQLASIGTALRTVHWFAEPLCRDQIYGNLPGTDGK